VAGQEAWRVAIKRDNAIQAQALIISRRTCAEIKSLRALSTVGQPSRRIINLAEKWHKEFECGERCKGG
jgi:hypothetical protein